MNEEFPRLRAVLEKAEFPEGTKAKFSFPKFEPSSYSCRACKSGTDEEIKRLKRENARLREALAFYAELEGSGIQLYGYMDSKALEFDDGESFPFGKKARDALKGAENDA